MCALMALPAPDRPSACARAGANTNGPIGASACITAAHQTAPQSTVSVDGSEAMFTTICALLRGFRIDVSSDNWTAFRAQMRERLRSNKARPWKWCGSSTGIMNCYPGTTLSRYLWFGLVWARARVSAGFERDELPPEVIALEGFSEILSNYYQEQKIGQLCGKCSRFITAKSSGWHDPVRRLFSSRRISAQILEAVRAADIASSSNRWWAHHQRKKFWGSLCAGAERRRTIPTDVYVTRFCTSCWTRSL